MLRVMCLGVAYHHYLFKLYSDTRIENEDKREEGKRVIQRRIFTVDTSAEKLMQSQLASTSRRYRIHQDSSVSLYCSNQSLDVVLLRSLHQRNSTTMTATSEDLPTYLLFLLTMLLLFQISRSDILRN